MKLIDSLIAEFDREAQTTRKHFERLPEDKLDWRPHEKSFTIIALAAHITELVGWTDAILNQDGLVVSARAGSDCAAVRLGGRQIARKAKRFDTEPGAVANGSQTQL